MGWRRPGDGAQVGSRVGDRKGLEGAREMRSTGEDGMMGGRRGFDKEGRRDGDKRGQEEMGQEGWWGQGDRGAGRNRRGS